MGTPAIKVIAMKHFNLLTTPSGIKNLLEKIFKQINILLKNDVNNNYITVP